MTTRSRHAVVTAAGTASLVAAALVLSGCSATNPITTQNNYEASDGVHAQVGDLRVLNLIVLSAGDGESGTLVGAVANDGDDTRVGLVVGGAEAGELRVRSGETVLLGTEDGEQVEVDAVAEAAGAFVDVTITSGAGSTTVPVPVLDGSLPEYEEYAPAPPEPADEGSEDETTELGDTGADGNTEN